MHERRVGVLAIVIILVGSASLRADLIHHWEFEDTFEDSAEGLDGQPMGNATFTADAKIGEGALEVGGGGDYVEIPDSDTLQFAQFDSYSLTAWVKAAPSSGWRGIVTKGRDVPPWYGIWIDPNSRWLYGTSGDNLAGSAVRFDAWVHAAIVQDGDLGTRDLYVDGEVVASNVARDAFNFGNVFIGGAGGVNEWFVGQIDDVRIYDEALDADGVVLSMGLEPPDCTDGPDTHCLGLTVADRDGNAASAGSSHPPGVFTVEVEARDDSGDPVLYELSADNGVDPPDLFASNSATFEVPLRVGTWTLSVTVDDKGGCDDAANDATCVAEPFTVETSGEEAELVHRWDFEDDFTDSVGEADGTPMGNAATTDDAMIGEQALQVNGSGDHVLVDDQDDGSLRFSAFDDYSVTSWVKIPESLGGWRGIVTKGRENPPWYGIWINPFNQWVYGANDAAGTSNPAGPTIETEVWTHVAIVQNGGLGTREMWLNGELQTTSESKDATSDSSLVIGGAGGVNEWFAGQIDDVRIYHGALDEEGIELSMSAPEEPGVRFVRGDTNTDGSTNITDGVFILNFLFGGEGDPLCLAALDANGDGVRNVTDAVFILNFLFGGGGDPPPAPFPNCGPDPSGDMVDCASFPACP